MGIASFWLVLFIFTYYLETSAPENLSKISLFSVSINTGTILADIAETDPPENKISANMHL